MPIEAVGDMPGHQGKAKNRKELGKADQPQGQRLVRYVIDLPAYRDTLHLNRQGRGQPHSQKKAKIAE